VNSNFRSRVWLPALETVGLSGIHFHDLRHTGNQFTAEAGANPRELMARMGHDSPRAELIYLHSSGERQRALADAVGDAARAELAKSKKRKKGTHLARGRHAFVMICRKPGAAIPRISRHYSKRATKTELTEPFDLSSSLRPVA
jgi:hypothetical protein